MSAHLERRGELLKAGACDVAEHAERLAGSICDELGRDAPNLAYSLCLEGAVEVLQRHRSQYDRRAALLFLAERLTQMARL